MYIESQKALVKAVGVSESHFSRFKQRKAKVSKEAAEKICKITGIEMYDLLQSSPKKLHQLLDQFYDFELARKRVARGRA